MPCRCRLVKKSIAVRIVVDMNFACARCGIWKTAGCFGGSVRRKLAEELLFFLLYFASRAARVCNNGSSVVIVEYVKSSRYV